MLNTQHTRIHTHTLHQINKFIVNAMQFSHLNAVILGNGLVWFGLCVVYSVRKLFAFKTKIYDIYKTLFAHMHNADCT